MRSYIRHFSTLAGFVAFAFMPPAYAAEPLRPAPSSNWHVNYAEDSCRLARSFRTGEEEVTLVLDRFRPGPKVRMTLVGSLVEVGNDVRKIILRFGPIGPPSNSSDKHLNSGEKFRAKIMVHSMVLCRPMRPRRR